MKQPARGFQVYTTTAGFTLVEIMVVVAIIAIIAGMLVITVGNQGERQLQQEAGSLYQKLQLVAEDAQFSGMELGLSVEGKSTCQFYQFDDELMSWKKLDSDLYKQEALPDGFELAIDATTRNINTELLYPSEIQEKARKFGENKHDEPQIMFFSDGQMTPFTIKVVNRDSSTKPVLIVSDGHTIEEPRSGEK